MKSSGNKQAYFLNVDDECVKASPSDCEEGECYTNNNAPKSLDNAVLPKSEPASVDRKKRQTR